MTQDADIQLKVWKDLAISKQILMGAATDALGLNAECSSEELKRALDKAIQRARDADINIQETRSEAERLVSEFRQRTEIAEAARAEAESRVAEAQEACEQAERQLAAGKADNAEALKTVPLHRGFPSLGHRCLYRRRLSLSSTLAIRHFEAGNWMPSSGYSRVGTRWSSCRPGWASPFVIRFRPSR